MTAHAVLGASSADRWMNCPGSVRLSAGLPDQTSEFAAEGTAAHELAERCLTADGFALAANYIGEEIPVGEFSFTVDEDMAEAVQTYLDHLYEIRLEHALSEEWVERRFSLESLRPPQPMFGTSDWTGYSRLHKLLVVRDYKHGRGKRVEVVGNPQLRYYALGALLSLPADYPVREIDVGVVQPRIGNIASERISIEELLDFAGELLAAAHATQRAETLLAPGDWCQWCRAKAICPALRDQALTVAQNEFSVSPPAPESLTPAQVAEVLEKADVIEAWIKAVRGHALREAEQGRPPPGYKLVQKRGTRKWTMDDDTVAERLALESGIDFAEFFERSVLSPAQAEKLLKARKVKIPEELVKSVSSGYTLTSEADKRPALAVSAADEFQSLPLPK